MQIESFEKLVAIFYFFRNSLNMPAQDWIRATLKERGYKLKDAAAALNITPPRMTDILKGMREVQSDEILPLATLLGLSSKSLLSSLAASKRLETGADIEGASLPVLGGLTGTGEIIPPKKNTKLTHVAVPPDAETQEGLYCYEMADDSLEQEIRQGSLVIAGDPRVHFFPMVPGSIFLIDLGNGKITARQLFRAENGEDWLVPLPRNHNPLYESLRFFMLPDDLDPARSRRPSDDGISAAGYRSVHTDDIVAAVMWVHRRYTPEATA